MACSISKSTVELLASPARGVHRCVAQLPPSWGAVRPCSIFFVSSLDGSASTLHSVTPFCGLRAGARSAERRAHGTGPCSSVATGYCRDRACHAILLGRDMYALLWVGCHRGDVP
jgi:hypothetical protein